MLYSRLPVHAAPVLTAECQKVYCGEKHKRQEDPDGEYGDHNAFGTTVLRCLSKKIDRVAREACDEDAARKVQR